MVISSIKGFIYLGYFILNSPYSQLWEKFKETKRSYNVSYIWLVFDMLVSAIVHKASFEDYFDFTFFQLSNKEKKEYICTGDMYEFQSHFNDKEYRKYFRDKQLFYQEFKNYIGRDYLSISNNNIINDIENWTKNYSVFFAKRPFGQSGKDVIRVNINNYENCEALYEYLYKNNFTLLEEQIEQHSELNRLSPNCVNTIRVITFVEQSEDSSYDNVKIIGAILRLGLEDVIDNLSAGGIAAPIDLKTGQVYKPAISKELIKDRTFSFHPVSDEGITGFEIPEWENVIKLVKEAAMIIPEVRTVGWDVAISPNGPLLIEGNDNWNKRVWQLAYREGKRKLIQKFADENV
ncbi:sugar-transfer associated ATP-grasp domain-containing protein [Natranaerobius trueperi]|uniref:Alpha-L-glutamate ligase-related protein ATP-grasp domain-containing protein n=1 Tax=Natranaerobius trueperi TaxID=759412 RepID=A0A226BW83_9FIRM|nr:sugar-transfer associated ATP-grasp domain-containing protein [Natranaerobius trueperi]OWZ83225.1 hypothetical protein CDO51_09600 [Natranaerobius trueperi]